MAMTLQEAIAESSIQFGGSALAEIEMSMHDADGPLLWGVAVAHFVPDLPLRDSPLPVFRTGELRLGSSIGTTTGPWMTLN